MNKTAKITWRFLKKTVLLFFSSASDPKSTTLSQTLASQGGKKPAWTASALALEAKELSHAVRAILELDCKWCPQPQFLLLHENLNCHRLPQAAMNVFTVWPPDPLWNNLGTEPCCCTTSHLSCYTCVYYLRIKDICVSILCIYIVCWLVIQ